MSWSTAEDTNDHSTHQQALEQAPEHFPIHLSLDGSPERSNGPKRKKKIFCFLYSSKDWVIFLHLCLQPTCLWIKITFECRKDKRTKKGRKEVKEEAGRKERGREREKKKCILRSLLLVIFRSHHIFRAVLPAFLEVLNALPFMHMAAPSEAEDAPRAESRGTSSVFSVADSQVCSFSSLSGTCAPLSSSTLQGQLHYPLLKDISLFLSRF